MSSWIISSHLWCFIYNFKDEMKQNVDNNDRIKHLK